MELVPAAVCREVCVESVGDGWAPRCSVGAAVVSCEASPRTHAGYGVASCGASPRTHAGYGVLRDESAQSTPRRLSKRWATSPHGEALHLLAGRALIAIRLLRRAEARITRHQAAELQQLQSQGVHRSCGFTAFYDFSREMFQLSPRTTRRRLALARLLHGSVSLAQAFDDGRVSACKVLALQSVATKESLPFWIELAQSLTVRELRERIQESQGQQGLDPGDNAGPGDRAASASNARVNDPDEEGDFVTFSAPLTAAVAWDQGLEMARNVLGWDAPPHVCVEAVLSEAESDMSFDATHCSHQSSNGNRNKGAREFPTQRDVERQSCVSTSRQGAAAAVASKGALAGMDRLRKTLAMAARELETLEDRSLETQLAGAVMSQTAEQEWAESISLVRSLRTMVCPIRTLLGRLLRDLQASGGLASLGYSNLPHFAESELGLSERTARRLLSEAFLFDDNPVLTGAFEAGRIGLGQAFLINRLALSTTLPRFIRRAEEITHLQFEREIRFLERLAEYAPIIAAEFRGPLPHPGLESAMLEALESLGLTRDKILKSLSGGRSVLAAGADPAVNTLVMRNLEVLLELLALANDHHDQEVRTGAAGALPTLAPESRLTTINFWAPDSTLGHWHRLVSLVQARCGPLPTWAAAIMILECAVREWERQDPKRRPRQAKILERDGYHCQVPGCSLRRQLEVHHIAYRSQAGGDLPENLITLCHGHHHLGIHGGVIRLRGNAPGYLLWEMQTPAGSGQCTKLRGSKIVSRSGDADDSRRRGPGPASPEGAGELSKAVDGSEGDLGFC